MAKRKRKPRAFWIGREKLYDCSNGKVYGSREYLIFKRKPKFYKDVIDRFNYNKGDFEQLTDLYLKGDIVTAFCPKDFEGITGITIEPGTIAQVKLVIV